MRKVFAINVNSYSYSHTDARSKSAAMDRATELSRKHTPEFGSRMLDVLHVACALEVGARTLVTYDERQAELGKSAGLKTVSP